MFCFYLESTCLCNISQCLLRLPGFGPQTNTLLYTVMFLLAFRLFSFSSNAFSINYLQCTSFHQPSIPRELILSLPLLLHSTYLCRSQKLVCCSIQATRCPRCSFRGTISLLHVSTHAVNSATSCRTSPMASLIAIVHSCKPLMASAAAASHSALEGSGGGRLAALPQLCPLV